MSRSVSFFHVHSRLYLALYEKGQAEILAKHEFQNKYIIRSPLSTVWSDAENGFSPGSLSEVYQFDSSVKEMTRKNPEFRIVFSSGAGSELQVKTAFLIGCHMIMSHGIGFEETFLAFRPLHDKIESLTVSNRGKLSVSFKSCLRAVCCAKCMNWVDFRDDLGVGGVIGKIPMDEYLHYAW